MLTLLRGIECFCPKYTGVRDIVIAGEKIYKITGTGEVKDYGLFENVISCQELTAFPGILDNHVHITGGGGEEGYSSRTDEITIDDILKAGVTTVAGLLGADGCLRSLPALYAKAKALEIQGLTTLIYSGSYSLPAITLTGSMTRDLALVDKVIGAGEIAVSDHRSSNPDARELIRLASQVHLGGLLSKKAGIMQLHFGDGKAGLKPLTDMLEQSDLPVEMFIPTHINRNNRLFEQGIEYCRSGGLIDLTSGEEEGVAVRDSVKRLIKENVPLSRVTVSSDSNGSTPHGGVGWIGTLFEDIKLMARDRDIGPEAAFRLVTENVAKNIGLYPQKGAIAEGADADIIITDRDYNIKKVLAKGRLLLEQ